MKFKYYMISFKRNIFSFIFLGFAICLVFFSSSNLSAAKSGLSLWAKFVVPTLFPFFVATEMMLHTNIINILGKLLNPIMKPIFKVPGVSSFAFVMGSISGYPVGAKIVTTLRNQCLVSKDEGERLLAFTNNSGPLFIVATVGIGLFGNSTTGTLLLCSHLLSAISVAILMGFFAKNDSKQSSTSNLSLSKDALSFGSIGEILSKSILNSINTLFLIGGFVVLFSVIISILGNSGFFSVFELILTPIFSLFNIDANFIRASIVGILEVTNGVNMISSIHIKNISINLIFTSFVLGFGGISVLLQILSVISKSDLSIKTYIIGKLMQATFSAFYTYIALVCFPGLNMDLTEELHFSIVSCILVILCIIVLCKIFYKIKTDS